MSAKAAIVVGFSQQYRQRFFLILGKALTDLMIAGVLLGVSYGFMSLVGTVAPETLTRYVTLAKSSLLLLTVVYIVVTFLCLLLNQLYWAKKQLLLDKASPLADPLTSAVP
jgi:amino acid permease